MDKELINAYKELAKDPEMIEMAEMGLDDFNEMVKDFEK